MMPKGFEWGVISVVLLIRVVLPIAVIALVVVLLVRAIRGRGKRAEEGSQHPVAGDAPRPQPSLADDGRRLDEALAERGLTDRERAVLIGIYQGKTQADLAEEQFLSRSTVGTYCTRAYEKLGVETKAEAIELMRSMIA